MRPFSARSWRWRSRCVGAVSADSLGTAVERGGTTTSASGWRRARSAKTPSWARPLVLPPPVRDPALLLRDVAAAVLVQLEGQGGHPGVSRGAAQLLQPGPGRHRPDPCNNATPA